MLANRANALSASARRCESRLCAGTLAAGPVRGIKTQVQTKSVEAPTAVVNVETLYARMEARAKAMIALEEQEIALRPKVKFSLHMRVGLGEGWKIVGRCPELGNFLPEVAPFMTWTTGDVWTLEVPVRPGKYIFKAVLRKPDGQYLWEDGPDRFFEVPYTATAKNTFELKLDNIRFPAF